MNAITIQRRLNGEFVITGPGIERFFVCLIVSNAEEMVGNLLLNLPREESVLPTIPERLENQAATIGELQESLKKFL